MYQHKDECSEIAHVLLVSQVATEIRLTSSLKSFIVATIFLQ